MGYRVVDKVSSASAHPLVMESQNSQIVRANIDGINPNFSGIGPLPVADCFNGTGPFFSAAEIEFIAENSLVTIKPRRKLEELDLLAVLGEFEGGFANGF